MNTIRYEEAKVTRVNENTTRRFIHTDNLLTAIVDFNGGPWKEPDSFHSHPHEQTCYIADGEILFFMDEEAPVQLKKGDMFAVPSGIKHTIQLLTPTARLIDSFNPVREDFL